MYEENPGTVTSALTNSSAVVFSAATISRILELTTADNSTVRIDTVAPNASGVVTVASGAEVLLVGSSDTAQTALTVPNNAPVVIFQGKGGINVVLDNGSVAPQAPPGVTERVVVGSAGNDKIVVADAKNTQVTLGSGNSTVVTGSGDDTVEAGLGNSTITGGSGHSVVKLAGKATDYVVTVQDGHAVVTHAGGGKTTDISNIQYVQLDNNKALVFANDSKEAAVSTLYAAAFGRDGDAHGLQYYFDGAKAGYSLTQIAESFLQSAEYKARPAQSDTDFISDLYQHTFARAAEAGGLAYWTAALASGASRAEVIANFVSVAGQNLDGAIHTEATVVGQVTIVHNIV